MNENAERVGRLRLMVTGKIQKQRQNKRAETESKNDKSTNLNRIKKELLWIRNKRDKMEQQYDLKMNALQKAFGAMMSENQRSMKRREDREDVLEQELKRLSDDDASQRQIAEIERRKKMESKYDALQIEVVALRKDENALKLQISESQRL